MRLLPLLALALSSCDSGAFEVPEIGYSNVVVTGWREISFEGNASARVVPWTNGEGYTFSLFLRERVPFTGNSLWVHAYPDRAEPLPVGEYEVISLSDSSATSGVLASFFATAESESIYGQRGALRIERVEDDRVSGTIWFEGAVLERDGWVEVRVEGAFEAMLLDRL